MRFTEHLTWQAQETGGVALNLKSGDYIHANSVAIDIFETFGTTEFQTIDLERHLQERYNLDPRTASEDAKKFIYQLQERKILEAD